MASDDQEVEAWYLEGWCFFLMAEQAKETGTKIEELSWEELAKDARDCLENCTTVHFLSSLAWFTMAHYFATQLHTSLQHPDERLLEHAAELITQLDALGIKPSSADEDEEVADEGWEDVDESDEDVEMS